MKACSDPVCEYVRKSCESRIKLRNLKFVGQQSHVLAPGTLLHCHVKKCLSVGVVIEPTVWTESDSIVLAYRIMNLDNDMQACSIPATAIVKVLHATDVPIHFELPVREAGSNDLVEELISRLPWNQRKLQSMAKLAGLGDQPDVA